MQKYSATVPVTVEIIADTAGLQQAIDELVLSTLAAKSFNVKIGELRERHYIIALDVMRAETMAHELGLTKPEWSYAHNAAVLQGLGRGRVVIVREPLGHDKRAREMRQVLNILQQSGCNVYHFIS